jgi:hypothetical protein
MTEPTESMIKNVTESLCHLLLEKNRRYGNSALQPLNIFSKEGAADQICTRLDDKLSRIKNSTQIRKNDVAYIMGYLLLLCVQNDWTNFDDLID